MMKAYYHANIRSVTTDIADCRFPIADFPRAIFHAQSAQLAIGNWQSAMGLLISVGNSSARQVVGRHLNTHAVANQDPDTILTHLAGDGGQYHMFTVVETHLEEGVGLLVDDGALRRD
jgi:hypothetical protein